MLYLFTCISFFKIIFNICPRLNYIGRECDAKNSMAHLGNSISVLSVNCQGLRNYAKRLDVINYFKETHASIVCLQDTHWTEKDSKAIETLWGNDIYLNGGQTNSRGVAFVFNNNFEYKVLKCRKDKNGNLLNLILKLSMMILTIICVYGPNIDNMEFYKL